MYSPQVKWTVFFVSNNLLTDLYILIVQIFNPNCEILHIRVPIVQLSKWSLYWLGILPFETSRLSNSCDDLFDNVLDWWYFQAKSAVIHYIVEKDTFWGILFMYFTINIETREAKKMLQGMLRTGRNREFHFLQNTWRTGRLQYWCSKSICNQKQEVEKLKEW